MVQYEPIGVIKTPYKEKKGTPIQPAGARDIRGRKPYVPEFDSVPDAEIGWLTTRVQGVQKTKSDGRTK